MANNKMLIDASHREETRVVVLRGNRIEEFDFEAQERRQLRGNIYLAKVTRVEPSLQAAFIDYGGNRHGFLAFAEIHPDYYQIPAADRQALIEAEARAAASEQQAEDEELDSAEAVASDDLIEVEEEEVERPAKKGRRKQRRGGRNRNASASDSTDDEKTEENATDSDADVETFDSTQESTGIADDSSEDGAPSTSSRTMSAMIEMDTISEDAPEPSNGDDGSSDNQDDAKPAKKPRKPRKKAVKKTADADVIDEATAATDVSDVKAETAKPARKRRSAKKPAPADAEKETVTAESTEESQASAPQDAEAGASDEAETKPKRGRRNSKKRNSGKGNAAKETDDDLSPDNGEQAAPKIESVGQEDALEEVPERQRPRRQYKIQEVIRRRQIMLVQVVKEERGNKGAALTTYLSLAGRYSVLMPNTARGGGISRKITNPVDRKRLKEIAGNLDVPKGMGVILRTAGAARTQEEINRDFDYLMRLWENVRDLTLASSAPFLVYEEGSLIKRSIRDLYNKDIGEIVVAGDEGYREAKDFMKMLMPSHSRNVVQYKGDQPLFSKFNCEVQLDKMLAPQVSLKSGGYLVINQTEALVAIDVNSGRSTREHSIEATALQTNLEAAEEVARQLRLRDLAGLVVIDFIDMEEKRNNRAVERKLKDCLKEDRARIQVGHISHFGLMEMSRQRIRASVLESTMATCPVCQGVGHVRSQSSLAIHILRAIDDHLTRNPRFDAIVKLNPASALYILNNKRDSVSALEDRFGVHINFVGDHAIESQEFAVEKGDATTREPKSTAVNPMHFETQADDDDGLIDTDELSVETEMVQVEVQKTRNNDAAESEDERAGRKRKRRRGRGRNGRDKDGQNDDQNNGQSQSEAGADTGNASSNGNPSNGDDERNASTQTSQSDNKRASQRQKASEPAKPAPKAKRVEIIEEDTTPREPRRKTGRPGKKIAGEASVEKAEPSAVETETEKPKGGAPAREVARRNTRRAAAPKAKKQAADGQSSANSNDEEKPEGWVGF